MKITNLFILIILTLIFSSCGEISSEDVNPDVIYTNYEVTYDDMTKELEVSSDFTVGGNRSTYVELVSPAQVRVNNVLASKEDNIINQIFYKYEQGYTNSNNIGLITIVYTDSEERSFSNQTTVPSKVTLSLSSSNLQAQDDLDLSYQIEDTSDSANLLYLHLNYGTGKLTKLVSTSLAASGTYSVNNSEMVNMKGKTVDAYLCRSKFNKSLDHPGEGGSLKSTFCSRHKTFTLQN